MTHQALKFSLLNCQKLTDQKIPEFDKITQNDYFSICTEINLSSQEHQNILECDSNYIWHFITKNSDNKLQQRIGIRIPIQVSNHIKFTLLSHAYLTGRTKSEIRDQTAIQWLLFKAQIYHLTFKIMVVYRVPAALDEVTERLYNDINAHCPLCLLYTSPSPGDS